MELAIKVLQSMYFILPAYLANMAPVIAKKIKFLEKLKKPIDQDQKFADGRSIFGKHKTYRGFLVAIIAGVIMAIVQSVLFYLPFFRWVSLPGLDYGSITIVCVLGFLMGTGAITGDLIKSFVKRRMNVNPGKKFLPWDQIDFVLGAYLFVVPFFIQLLSWQLFVSSVLTSFFLHIIVNHIAYYLHIRKEKW
jgi:CDP-2,3-bis-(O-geranylgeranyl)-sn-glycerol synthase